MVACAYCEQPLICDSCRVEYSPPTQEQYEALSHREDLVFCPRCEQVLVCHWCKTPYDGATEDESAEEPRPSEG
jgi:hypothetical protein